MPRLPLKAHCGRYTFTGTCETSQRLEQIDEQLQSTSAAMHAFLCQRFKGNDPDLSLPAGTVIEGYWEHVEVSLELSDEGRLWTWVWIDYVLIFLRDYFEDAVENYSLVLVDIRSAAGERPTFPTSLVESIPFRYAIPRADFADDNALGDFYPDDPLPEADCITVVRDALRWTEAQGSDNIIPDGESKAFSSYGLILMSKSGYPFNRIATRATKDVNMTFELSAKSSLATKVGSGK